MLGNREYTFFVKRTIFLVIFGILLAVLFVVIIDPYRIYGVIDQISFNQVKPVPDRYQEQIKLLGAKRLNANALILGNSRAEIGFDPDDKVFSDMHYVSYNLAIPGSGIDTAERQLGYMHSINQRPKVIILGLDFLDFLTNPNSSLLSKVDTKKTAEVDGIKWQFDAVFSLHSVSDAFKTMQIQHKPEVETITSKGFNPLFEYNKYAREQGYYALFQQRAEENAKNYLRKSHYIVAPASDTSAHWRDLRAILATASEDNTELHLVIYPYHAQILLMFEQVGLLPAFEQWKMQLTKELDSAKNQRAQSNNHLWDFSGYSAIQCEIIPAKADKLTKTKWYWEAGHFKSTLGSLMLSRILDKPAPDVSNSFGFLLNSTNISANNQRLAEEKRTCLSSYPKLLNDVNLVIGKSQQKRL